MIKKNNYSLILGEVAERSKVFKFFGNWTLNLKVVGSIPGSAVSFSLSPTSHPEVKWVPVDL